VRPSFTHLISDALPFGALWDLQVADAIEYAKHYSRAHDAVISVYDAAGKLIEVHRHKGKFKEAVSFFCSFIAVRANRI